MYGWLLDPATGGQAQHGRNRSKAEKFHCVTRGSALTLRYPSSSKPYATAGSARSETKLRANNPVRLWVSELLFRAGIVLQPTGLLILKQAGFLAV